MTKIAEATQKLALLNDVAQKLEPVAIVAKLMEIAGDLAEANGDAGPEAMMFGMIDQIGQIERQTCLFKEVNAALSGEVLELKNELALYKESAPDLSAWPKRCGTCKREHTPEQWACLEKKGYVGSYKANGERYTVELRNCICTSTLGVDVRLPMAEVTR